MTEIYRSDVVRPSAEGAPVVIHCSDPRFQPHFQKFLSAALKLDGYALIAVPGGPQVLALRDEPAAWRWMQFMSALTHTTRVVLIVHDDCRWYLQSLAGEAASRVQETMYDDARRVRAALVDRLGIQRVEIYHAGLTEGRAVFEAVT